MTSHSKERLVPATKARRERIFGERNMLVEAWRLELFSILNHHDFILINYVLRRTIVAGETAREARGAETAVVKDNQFPHV